MTHTITWLDDELVTEVRLTATTPYFHSATGYGRKIPTRYMLRITGRWHRVYMMCYSNSGTAYVLKGGKELILETSTEHRIQLHRDAVHKAIPGRATQPVRIDLLPPGGRFRFHADGVVSTLVSAGGGLAPEGQLRLGRYTWTDYQGEHLLHCGTYSLTQQAAWPYVLPTDEAETVVNAA